MGRSVTAQQGRMLGMTALLSIALLATACSASSDSPPPGPVASPASCASSGLQATVNTSQIEAAGGRVYVPIDFTNTTKSTCTMSGYPGVSFVTSPPYSVIGRAATRVRPKAATLVTLAPGGVAHAVIRVTQVRNYRPSECVPVAAPWLRIYPPNQSRAIYARYAARACDALLPRRRSQLAVYVVKPGPGKAGHAP
jgi:Protein of unknown function (DUF4232)